MDVIIPFRCPLSPGLHARPASRLLAISAPFLADIRWRNLRNGREADVRSPLAVLGTDTLFDDPCEIRIEGTDAAAAGARIERFLASELADDPSPAAAEAEPALPPFLDPACWAVPGRATVAGLALGVLSALAEPTPASVPAESPAERRRRLDAAMVAVRRSLAAEVAGELGVMRDILVVQANLLAESALADALERAIVREASAFAAIDSAAKALGATLSASGNPALADRAQDVADLCGLLGEAAYPDRDQPPPIAGSAILAARRLTPRQVLAVARQGVQALLLEQCGPASHVAVLARALGLPAVTGVDGTALAAHSGETVMVDGHNGIVFGGPASAIQRRYRAEADLLGERRRRQAAVCRPSVQDGGPHLSAAVISTEQGRAAFAEGAPAIGLFRTEMLFLGRDRPPDEEEQTALYGGLVGAAGGREVTFRTADFGGDKMPPYLTRGNAAPPRGVAMYRAHPQLFRSQIRSLLRTAALGPVRLLIPMVTSVADMAWVRDVLQAERQSVRIDRLPPIGAMLEGRTAAALIGRLAPFADFFQVGANDLAQDLLGVDRDDGGRAASLCQPHPPLLRLMADMIGAARRHHRPIGLCGELAAQRPLLPLLAGLGFDGIAVDGRAFAETGIALSRVDPKRCRAVARAALDCPDAAAVLDLLAQSPVEWPQPIIDTDCIALDCDWRSPQEAISGLVGRLWLAGRVQGRTRLERTLWEREQLSATGMGFGIATPHARSPVVSHPTIAVAKLREPVVWPSVDGRPVHTVIMLAMGMQASGKAHLRLFSRLARSLVTESFRDRLQNCADAGSMLALMTSTLAEEC